MQIDKLVLTIALALFAAPAFAYIDPNTGGYLFQLLAPLVAILISAWVFLSDKIKAIWHSFLSTRRRNIDKE